MWLIGVVVLMSFNASIVALANRRRKEVGPVPYWNYVHMGESYGLIVGPLAGISVAAAVFLASVTRAAQSPSFVDVMATFLISIIILMGNGMMLATFRSAEKGRNPGEDFESAHGVVWVLCSIVFYSGVTMSWIGLRPMLISIDLVPLANVFTWLLLFTILSGCARLGGWLFSLVGTKAPTAILVAVLPIGTAAIYRLILVPALAWLWPSAGQTLTFAVVVLAVSTLAFGVETSMIAFVGEKRMLARVRHLGPILLPPYVAMVETAVALLWLSVAVP
jgi:hypothetical protein